MQVMLLWTPLCAIDRFCHIYKVYYCPENYLVKRNHLTLVKWHSFLTPFKNPPVNWVVGQMTTVWESREGRSSVISRKNIRALESFSSNLGAKLGASMTRVRQASLLPLSPSITEVITPSGPAPYNGKSLGQSLVDLVVVLFTTFRCTLDRYPYCSANELKSHTTDAYSGFGSK